ncbi:MAG: Gfo/Idh/MocA family oxidoreductase [Pseudomonadota bacterium]
MHWLFVGASTIASQHMIAAIRAQADSHVDMIVSGSADRAKRWAEAHDVPGYTTDLDAALRGGSAQAVYISSTNEKHFAQAVAAISAGKHVLCEKPLAMSVEDAARMVAAARTAGVTFGTNHHLRCAGSHRRMKALIREGRIGRVLSLRIHHAVYLPEILQGWRINSAEAGGGVIPDITVHDADVARFLLDEDPRSVVAQTGVSGMGAGVEDSVMSVWEMPSGAMVMAHESFTHRYAGTALEIHGEKGSIFASGIMTQRPVGKIELVTETGREDVRFSDHDLYIQGVGEFTAAVLGTGRPAADGRDGVKSLAVALAVREAAEARRRVMVDYAGAA